MERNPLGGTGSACLPLRHTEQVIYKESRKYGPFHRMFSTLDFGQVRGNPLTPP